MKWKLYWSRGPMDNPQDGVEIIEGENAFLAVMEWAEANESVTEIDAIVRCDLEDLVPVRRNEIEELLVDQIRTRRDKGRAKYGVSMERTDLTREQWLQHAIEELLDASIYLQKLKRDFPMTENEETETTEPPRWRVVVYTLIASALVLLATWGFLKYGN